MLSSVIVLKSFLCKRLFGTYFCAQGFHMQVTNTIFLQNKLDNNYKIVVINKPSSHPKILKRLISRILFLLLKGVLCYF